MTLQLVSVSPSGSLVLHQDALQAALATVPPTAPLSVMSINGALRTGKSTLQAALHGYLTNNQSWTNLGSSSYKWKWGRKPETMGITCVPAFNVEGIGAVLLLDTQGLFDGHVDVKTTVALFAISTLLSSFVVFNVEKRVGEDALQHASLFGEFATAYETQMRQQYDDAGQQQQQHKHSPPFDSLEFLVRDYEYFDDEKEDVSKMSHDRWLQEGEEYAARFMSTETPDLPHDSLHVRRSLLATFTNVSCCVLPHPGLSMTQANFAGDLTSQADPAFVHLLHLYLQHVKKMLQPKRLFRGMDELRVMDFTRYAMIVVPAFANNVSSCIPEPQTLLQAMTECTASMAMEHAMSTYARVLGHGISHGEMEGRHERARTEALAMYDDKTSFGLSDVIAARRVHVQEEIENKRRNRILLHRAKIHERRKKVALAVVAGGVVTAPVVLPPLMAISSITGMLTSFVTSVTATVSGVAVRVVEMSDAPTIGATGFVIGMTFVAIAHGIGPRIMMMIRRRNVSHEKKND